MKKILVFSILAGCLVLSLDAQTVQRRGQTVVNQDTANQVVTSQATARSARSATRVTPAATNTATNPVQRTARSAVSATAQRTATDSSVSARSAVTSVRAAVPARQKAVGTGTTVTGAAKNIIVSDLCRDKYMGCMDSFCMIENDNGGRCYCSDVKVGLDEALGKIEKLDEQSYLMATKGIEALEMGKDALEVEKTTSSIINSYMGEEKTTRKSLDLSMWDFDIDLDEESSSLFAETETDPLANKSGDALHRTAANICSAQVPECAGDLAMLKMMYSQNIKSDCTAYDNTLKRQRLASAQKLAAAEKGLREAALDSFRIANKWDLGQCSAEFKKCMATTAGCNDDFTGCVGIAAAENAKNAKDKSNSVKMHQIKGTYTTISIAASTMDALLSKKGICENITNSCVNVKDQVWDTFVREVAPTIKSAELIAESDLRTSCISNISQCFHKACTDTFDTNVNNPDAKGSVDACLTRPEMVESLCKVQIEPCQKAEPLIMDFVRARLAGMRVDSCTTQVKECLQSENICGSDYSQCIGLDTDTIIRMCPYDKLVGCQMVYEKEGKDIRGDAVYDELERMVQGIMIGIDDSMLENCQNAVNESMVKVCGSTEDCNGLAVDEGVGARSLEYRICEYTTDANNGIDLNYSACRTDISQISDLELGRMPNSIDGQMGPVTPFSGVLSGLVFWESVDFDEDGNLLGVDKYIETVQIKMTPVEIDKVRQEIAGVQKSISAAITTIEADPKVQYCMTGRQVEGMANQKIGREGVPRFKNLTKQMRMTIAAYALKAAKENYYEKYDELSEKMLTDYAKIAERLAEIAGENALDARRDIARKACVAMADASILPKSPNPPGSPFGKILAVAVMVGAAATIAFTGGASIAVAGVVFKAALSTSAIVGVGASAVTAAGIALASSSGSGANGPDGTPINLELIGSRQLNQWNYKETVTSTFTWTDLMCDRCIRAQKCGKTKSPIFGKKYCGAWEDEVNTCKEIQF